MQITRRGLFAWLVAAPIAKLFGMTRRTFSPVVVKVSAGDNAGEFIATFERLRAGAADELREAWIGVDVARGSDSTIVETWRVNPDSKRYERVED